MIVRRHLALVPVLLAALVACGGGTATTPTTPPPATTVAPTTTSAAATTQPAAAARCVAGDLELSLGAPTGEGQRTVQVVYTNVSDRPCEARGVPGLDLRGPDDPTYGPSYSVFRQGADQEHAAVTVAPGSTVSAPLTYLTDPAGWLPAELVTTPPGDTAQLTVPWNGEPVLRQDGATRPGTYIGPLAAAA